MSGYIKLYRDLQDNPLWQEKPFTRGQAWVDMIFRCNHRCARMGPQYQCVLVKRGSFVNSNVKLADAWGWSEKTVRRFMEYLQKCEMILYESMGKFCRYSVINYAEYQAIDTELFESVTRRADAEKKPRKRRADAEQMPTNNNDNNDNNENKGIYVTAQHLSMTKEEYDKLVALYGQSLVDSKIEYASNYKKLKNYVSLYKTLNNWLKADKKDSNNPFV